MPVVHVENASATGSSAFREAYLYVAGGHADMSMAIGFDDMQRLAGVGQSKNSTEGVILPGRVLRTVGSRTHERRRHDAETLAEIAAKNWNHAALNPMAQRQAESAVTAEQILRSKMIAEPLTSMMAAAVGTGAAAAVLCRAELARELQPDRAPVIVAASVLQSEHYVPHHIFLGPVVGPTEMTRTSAAAAYEMAGLGPEDSILCRCTMRFRSRSWSITSFSVYVGKGRVTPGGGRSHEAGRAIPFSTDGGLIGRGHPGGPTGLAQIWETTLQLRGEAGGRQVPDARVGLCHMVGGGSVCLIHILQRA